MVPRCDPIPNSDHHILRVSREGSYEVEVMTGSCRQRSEPQPVIRCGDDPPIVAPPPIADNTPPPPPPETRERPLPVAPSELSTNGSGEPTRLRNRRVKTQEEITFQNQEATLFVWDHAAADLDTVSINVNGEWILENYCLIKRKLEIRLR